MYAKESEVKNSYLGSSLFSSFSSFSSFWSTARPSSTPFTLPLEALIKIEHSPNRKKVLIADDMAVNRKVLKYYLQENYECHFAKDGAEAVEKHADFNFDIILMDLQMPNKDGIEATKEIRAREKQSGARAVPIFAITSTPEYDKEKVIGTYFDKLVSKNRLIEEINKKLKEVEVADTYFSSNSFSLYK